MKSGMEETAVKNRQISFHFHPDGFESKTHTVEKSDGGGQKRRYLKGIASGLQTDAHGERMTQKAIDSFMEQANSGDILLFADVHGIKFSEDIGILTKAEVSESGDWLTEYRLYDNTDGVDQISVQRADKIWKQINGLPPYKHPRQKGFSIEGFVPDEEGLIQMSQDGRQVINMVQLDGVVVVPRPAYKDSIAHSVYKALGVEAPWMKDDTLVGRLRNRMIETEEKESFYRSRYQIEDAVESMVQEALCLEDVAEKRGRLEDIYDEYKWLMIDLIIRNPRAFDTDEIRLDQGAVEAKVAKSNLLKGLIASLTDLESVYKSGVTR